MIPGKRSPAPGNVARWVGGAAALSAMLGCPPALAHLTGPETGILGVVAADPEGPTVLRLSEGLAVRDGERWSYVCPAAVGLDDPPMAEAAPGKDAWVVGAEALYVLLPDGTFERHGAGPPEPPRVAALASTGADVFALEFRSEGSVVHRMAESGASPVLRSAAPWTLLAGTADGLHLARVDGAALDVLAIATDGTEVSRTRVPLDLGSAVPRLRPAGTGLFVSVRREDSDTLYAVNQPDAGAALGSLSPISGPVATEAGALWVATGGVLGRILASELIPVASDERVTCVDEHAGQAYACTQRRLYRLDEEGLGQPVADLILLDGPVHTPPGAEGARCEAQWQRFHDDLVASGAVPEETADAGEKPPSADPDASVSDVSDADTPSNGCACRFMKWQRNDINGQIVVLCGVLAMVIGLRHCTAP